jgi:prepilin-type N-terminal cleavage/methylation domain-containing protein
MRRARGMTMIEVLVALLVATVGLLGGLAMISSLLSGSSFSRHASEAQILAQSRLEQLQSLTGVVAVAPVVPADTGVYPGNPVFVGEVNTAQAGVTQPIDPTGVHNTTNNMNIFYREVSWQTYADPLVAQPRRLITVRVCWSEGAPLTACVNTNPPSGYHEVLVAGLRLP